MGEDERRAQDNEGYHSTQVNSFSTKIADLVRCSV